ncbi:alpha/beta fold hydrolase [Actinoplanes sp. L3-i22]|uniref:alpha/beta fold hydrolase n=1 Tax=Actinoplanes sp. L3-i22 TaxID=2836373 RepID=UPI001C7658D1|nr:alpha/beta hydrolase [Actinoplanes sp. L3-i22]BCY08249.1 hypothetical protein L3i22_033370 [Actinoplanes sp. L3-i22]
MMDQLAWTDTGGDGPVLLLIHAGGFADWLVPLAAEPALDGLRVIRLTRAGYTGVEPPPGLTVADHAGHAAALLRHLGAVPAHVVAHSSGTTIALQLAFDHPDLVSGLTLSEPPLVDTLVDPVDLGFLHATIGPAIGAAMGAMAHGDRPGAFGAFMTAVCGPEYREVMTRVLGAEGLSHAERDCGYFFTAELPAVAGWTLDPAIAGRLAKPVLLIEGGRSPAPTHRLVARLAGLFPQATTATVENANHLLPLTAPAELADLIAAGLRVTTHRS